MTLELALRIYFFLGFSNTHLMFCFNVFDDILEDVKADKKAIIPFVVFFCVLACFWPIFLVAWLLDLWVGKS